MKTFAEYAIARDSEMGIINLSESTLFESQSLYKEMAILNPNAIAKTQNAFQFIHNNNIKGVLIGGMAVSHFASDRALTPDVDFLVEDMAGLKQLLLSQKIPFQQLSSSGITGSGANGGIHVPQIDADFLDAKQNNVVFNQYILKTAVPARIGGVSFPVINPAVLAIRKLDLGREKDIEDAFKLLPTIPKEMLKLHLKALQHVLTGDIDAKTIWSYASAMSV